MAQQTFNNGETGLSVRTKLNENADDAEARLGVLEAQAPTNEQTTNKGIAGGYPSLNGAGKIPLSQMPNEVQGAIRVIGFWDADTNTPDLSSLTLEQGEAYQVSVAGSTNLNGETNWKAKDLVVWNDTLLGNWFKLDNTDDVTSVFGRQGAVVPQINDYSSNLIENLSGWLANSVTGALNLIKTKLDKFNDEPKTDLVTVGAQTDTDYDDELVPGLVYPVTQDGDYLFHAAVRGYAGGDLQPGEILFGVQIGGSGSYILNEDSREADRFAKKSDDGLGESVQTTHPLTGLSDGDNVGVFLQTFGEDFEVTKGKITALLWKA